MQSLFTICFAARNACFALGHDCTRTAPLQVCVTLSALLLLLLFLCTAFTLVMQLLAASTACCTVLPRKLYCLPVAMLPLRTVIQLAVIWCTLCCNVLSMNASLLSPAEVCLQGAANCSAICCCCCCSCSGDRRFHAYKLAQKSRTTVRTASM
jgi:hypothetical protein